MAKKTSKKKLTTAQAQAEVFKDLKPEERDEIMSAGSRELFVDPERGRIILDTLSCSGIEMLALTRYPLMRLKEEQDNFIDLLDEEQRTHYADEMKRLSDYVVTAFNNFKTVKEAHTLEKLREITDTAAKLDAMFSASMWYESELDALEKVCTHDIPALFNTINAIYPLEGEKDDGQ